MNTFGLWQKSWRCHTFATMIPFVANMANRPWLSIISTTKKLFHLPEKSSCRRPELAVNQVKIPLLLSNQMAIFQQFVLIFGIRIGVAVGWNPICIIVPCHRVLSADGRLTGYSGGMSNKIALLRLEGCKIWQSISGLASCHAPWWCRRQVERNKMEKLVYCKKNILTLQTW